MFVVCNVRVSLQRAVFSKLVKKNLYLTGVWRRERVGQVIGASAISCLLGDTKYMYFIHI